MKTSKYPFKVKKTGCSNYSVEFYNKKYIMYKSDNYRKKCWVMEELSPFKPLEMQFKWFGCKKLSNYLDMLKLIYENNTETLKNILDSFNSLKGDGNGKKETK